MSTEGRLGDLFVKWAELQPEIHAVIQIGSRLRADSAPDAPDEYSDWDFHIVTEKPDRFQNRHVLDDLAIGGPIAYVNRVGRLGSSRKVTALFGDGELDLVIIPLNHIDIAQAELNAGSSGSRILSAGLTDLAAVISGGYKVIKDSGCAVSRFLAFVQQNIPPPRYSDEQVQTLAEGFVCDYVSTLRKIQRGEFIAAQRWLHCYLHETNFRLLHEHRQRSSQPSFPDARRLEVLLSGSEYNQWMYSSTPNRECLQDAVEKAASIFRCLIAELLPGQWKWPSSISHLRRE